MTKYFTNNDDLILVHFIKKKLDMFNFHYFKVNMYSIA